MYTLAKGRENLIKAQLLKVYKQPISLDPS